MSCEIIQFSNAPRRLEKIKTSTRVGEDIDNLPAEIDFRSPGWKARKAERAAAADRPVTAINSDLRKERQEIWRMAEVATSYWKKRLDFHGTLQSVQKLGMPEGRNHPTVTQEDRNPLLDSWRAALVKQLLTPAPDANSVKWKQATFAGGQHKYTDTNPKKIERAIAADVAWLAGHPTKKSRPMSNERKEERRAFKEAMRQRIREIAASRDIPDDEIRPALSLKHRHIVEFATKYSVNFEWLLEGVGPMFKAWPTS
jgi:hypothetical protein